MRLSLVLGTLGKLLQVFALAFLAPLALAVLDALRGDGWSSVVVFTGAPLLTWGAGFLLARWFETRPTLLRAEALGIVAGSWLLVAHFSAIPYWAFGLDYVSGLFESMSGLTTTGATVFLAEDFAQADRALFLWLSLIHI